MRRFAPTGEPEHLLRHIDRSIKINGNFIELRHDLLVTNASDF